MIYDPYLSEEEKICQTKEIDKDYVLKNITNLVTIKYNRYSDDYYFIVAHKYYGHAHHVSGDYSHNEHCEVVITDDKDYFTRNYGDDDKVYDKVDWNQSLYSCTNDENSYSRIMELLGSLNLFELFLLKKDVDVLIENRMS